VLSKEKILKLLEKVKDPEIGYDVVSLGEIDDIIIENNKVLIKFLPTTPLCPYLPYLFDEIERVLKENYPNIEVEFEIVTDKQWSIDRIKPEIREKLGL
jgi:metal-sulfur cluster biosynthetic enzyme